MPAESPHAAWFVTYLEPISAGSMDLAAICGA